MYLEQVEPKSCEVRRYQKNTEIIPWLPLDVAYIS